VVPRPMEPDWRDVALGWGSSGKGVGMDTAGADASSSTTTPDAGEPTATASHVVAEADAPTLAALYTERVRLTPDEIAFRHFEADAGWQSCTWRELETRAERYAASFQRAGLSPGDRVGVHMMNQPDWFAIDWAVHQLGLVMVALYSDDTGASMARMLADSGARIAILKDIEDWNAVRQHHALADIETIVLHRGPGVPGQLRLQTLDVWLAEGRPLPAARSAPSAMATIVYTSGATGTPRGVMLSHTNIISNVFACLRAIPLIDGDSRLSVLPLAHMFERTSGAYAAIAGGASTVFGRGASFIGEDLLLHRPTLMVAVPRVYEKLHSAIMVELAQATPARRALFRIAVATGQRARRPDLTPMQSRWLPLGLTRRVGQSILDRLGGRLRVAISGGAALAPEISRTFVALGIPLLQGYGLSEASPVVSANRLDDNDPGSVGRVVDNVETRVGPGGELLVRGPSVMMGYWRDKGASEAAIDAAGWLHTGDKVSRLDTRRIYLTGRIKDLIVTATGEKAAPSDIESLLRQVPVVDQVMVVGEARPYLGALVVPEAKALGLLRKSLGIDSSDDSELARERLECAVQKLCSDMLREAPKNHQVRRIVLVPTPWTIASGLVTPSLKLKRTLIERACPDEVDRLYAGHVLAEQTDCSRNARLG